jgi:hypothetical protein
VVTGHQACGRGAAGLLTGDPVLGKLKG